MLCPASAILVLDDFPDTVEAVATWLAIEGWRPLCAHTVDEALDCLAREPISAIVMEPHLLSGSAVEVARAARSERADRVLLISVSANGRCGDHTSYEPTLFDFNLVKPVPMEHLSRILREHRVL